LRFWLERRFGRGWLKACALAIHENELLPHSKATILIRLGRLFSTRKLPSFEDQHEFGCVLSTVETACRLKGWKPSRVKGPDFKGYSVPAQVVDTQAEVSRLYGIVD
jgi:hypothetical protein